MKLPFQKRAAVATVEPVRVKPRETPPIPEVARRTGPSLEPGAADVRQRLIASGISNEMCEQVLRSLLASGARGAYAIDAAARILGASFRAHPSPKRHDAAHVIAFVGPPGSGKTTTLAKLGRRLQGAGRSVAYASFDPQSMAALERVGGRETDVDRTEIPLTAVRNSNDLNRYLRRLREVDVVLVDTPGFSPREEHQLEKFVAELEPCRVPGQFEVYLVLPASASRASLSLACRTFARLRPDAAVLTMIDETNAPAAALEAIHKAGFAPVFLCDGQDVRGHLERPKPDHYADLCLRGKLA